MNLRVRISEQNELQSNKHVNVGSCRNWQRILWWARPPMHNKPSEYSSIWKSCPKRCCACLMNNGASIQISPAVRINTQEHRTADIVSNDCLRGEFRGSGWRTRTWRKNAQGEEGFYTMWTFASRWDGFSHITLSNHLLWLNG